MSQVGKVKESTAEQIDLLEFKRVVLQNLVRRLYKLAEEKNKEEDKDGIKQLDDKIFEKISDLFKRAVAKEVKEEIKNDLIERNKVHIEKEKAINFATSPKLLGIAISFLAAAIMTVNPIPNFGVGNQILPILTGIVPSVSITLTWAFKKTHTQETQDDHSASYFYSNELERVRKYT